MKVGYLAMNIRSWHDFELTSNVPIFRNLPLTIEGLGLGYCIIYATYTEALENAPTASIYPVSIPDDWDKEGKR